MSSGKTNPPFKSADELAHAIAELAAAKKADDVTILDVSQQTSITDFLVICSGNSDVHVKAICDTIQEELKPPVKPWHSEGVENRRWVLLDYVDVVVHIFLQEARDYYQLERLWADAAREQIGVPATDRTQG
ncbi:MAG: ribosome silencing factor [Fidelibacterota bacterium]